MDNAQTTHYAQPALPQEALNHWYYRGKLHLEISQNGNEKGIMWLNLAANNGHIRSILLLNKLRTQTFPSKQEHH